MSSTLKLQSGDGILIENELGNTMLFTCSGDPTSTDAATNAPGDSVSGFAVGCMCMRTDNAAVTDMIYFNTGSTSSCTWTSLKIDSG